MATAAKTKQDVDQMDKYQKKWDSLTNTFDTKRKSTAEQFAKNYSAADRAAQARGMGRSTQNLQTLANINKQAADAQGDIDSEQIATYENWAAEEEQRELENERCERTFAENQRQFNESQALTKGENALNRAFQTSERLGTQEYQSGENALNRAFQTSEREGQQAWQSGENQLNREFTTSEREASQRYQTSEREASQIFQTSERLGSQAFTAEQNSLNREYQREQAAKQLALQQAQLDEQKRQFDAEFGLKSASASSSSSGSSGKSSSTGNTNNTSSFNLWDWLLGGGYNNEHK